MLRWSKKSVASSRFSACNVENLGMGLGVRLKRVHFSSFIDCFVSIYSGGSGGGGGGGGGGDSRGSFEPPFLQGISSEDSECGLN